MVRPPKATGERRGSGARKRKPKRGADPPAVTSAQDREANSASAVKSDTASPPPPSPRSRPSTPAPVTSPTAAAPNAAAERATSDKTTPTLNELPSPAASPVPIAAPSQVAVQALTAASIPAPNLTPPTQLPSRTFPAPRAPPAPLGGAIEPFNFEAMTRNFARLIEEGGRAVAAYLKPREDGTRKVGYSDEIADAAKTLGHVMEYWYADPQRTVEMQTRLGKAYLDLFASASRRFAGEPAEPVVKPDPRDKRFADREWTSNQYFDFLKQAYLIGADWAKHLVDKADLLDPATRQKADFYMRQIVNAASPSNYILTNPELMRTTLHENAENLVRGVHMLAEDIEAGGGELKIRQSDASAFEVGRNLAVTPGKVIYQNELMQLIQYAPATAAVRKRPLLMVAPWINKFYVLDLTPEKSFIKWCVDQGLTVFVISWVNPDERLAQKSFEDYIREGPLEALGVIAQITGEERVDALGYCVGGTLLAIALAYMAAKDDRRIASVTFLTTQVDFTYAGDLKVFATTEEQVESLEREMAARGYLDGAKMATAFNLLRSNDLVWPYVVNNYLKGEAPFPFDLLYWNADATRMPAANHSYYLRNCYLGNNITRGRAEIDDVRIDLRRVIVPIYNLATREDHIAPARSVFLGSSSFGAEVRFVLSGSGHIAGVVNPPAKRKYQYWTGDTPRGDDIDTWLRNAAEHPGSWWTDWIAWIKAQDGEEVPARVPGGGKVVPIEDAPGSYVKVRS
jgi:polyhydroxyalkanoate synthase